MAFFLIRMSFCDAVLLETSGEVISYTKESNWKEDVHGINLKFSFEQEDQIREHLFFIPLSPEEFLHFDQPFGAVVDVLEEIPDKIIGKALFTLKIGANTYHATGAPIYLVREDYGLSEDQFMVIKAEKSINWKDNKFFYYITLDGGDFFPFATTASELFNDSIKEGMVLKIEKEEFIPTNPGYSEFIFRNPDNIQLNATLKSKNAHWIFSSEQLNSMITVRDIDFRIISGFGGRYAITTIHFDNGGSFRMGNSGDNWVAIGNRWVWIRDKTFLDLDSARIVVIGDAAGGTAYPKEIILKVW